MLLNLLNELSKTSDSTEFVFALEGKINNMGKEELNLYLDLIKKAKIKMLVANNERKFMKLERLEKKIDYILKKRY